MTAADPPSPPTPEDAPGVAANAGTSTGTSADTSTKAPCAENSATGKGQSKTSAASRDDDGGTSKRTKSHWFAAEACCGMMAEHAARKNKSSSTRVDRAQLTFNYYLKFAQDMVKRRTWPQEIDPKDSRDIRCAFQTSGKNAGDSPVLRKVGELRREIINIILPIWNNLVPTGIPPSGKQWPEIVNDCKKAYYHHWRSEKQRLGKAEDMPEGWSCIALDVFWHCGPRGLKLSFLEAGSLEDDDTEDTSRKGARAAAKEQSKKARIERQNVELAAPSSSSKPDGRVAMAASLDAANRTNMYKLLITHGNEEQKAMALSSLAAALAPSVPASASEPPATPAQTPATTDDIDV